MAGAQTDIAYQSLDPLKNEIRLLRILYEDQDPDSPVCASLITVSLDNKPFYQALSYCWGDPILTHTIVLDGKPVPVTANLDAALRELRRREIRTVWADALCINQGNNVEKGHQVASMGNVYALAAAVFVWLGPRSSDSDAIMDEIGRHPGAARSNSRADCDIENDTALDRLLARPYWGRAWIVQELVKARSITVLCGNKSLHWDTLIAALPALSRPKSVLNDLRASARDRNDRLLLIDALVRTYDSQTSENLDRLYSLFPLASDRHLFREPDYDMPSAIVFAEVSKTMIMTGSISVLFLSRYCERSTKWQAAAPSWAVNWAGLQAGIPPWILRAYEHERTVRQSRSLASKSNGGQQDVRSLPLSCFMFINIEAIALDVDVPDLSLATLDVSLSQGELNGLPLVFLSRVAISQSERYGRRSGFGDLWRRIGLWEDAGELPEFRHLPNKAANRLNPDRIRGRFDGGYHKLIACSLDYLATWLSANPRFFQVGQRQSLGNLIKRRPTDKLDALALVTAALALASTYGSAIAKLEGGRVWAVPRDSHPGDRICWPVRSDLPIVLRPCPSGGDTFTYIGEVSVGIEDVPSSYLLAPQSRQERAQVLTVM